MSAAFYENISVCLLLFSLFSFVRLGSLLVEAKEKKDLNIWKVDWMS